MNIKLDHFNISVSNLEESTNWYRKIFGFELVETGISHGVKWGIIAFNDSMICMGEYPGRTAADKMNKDNSTHHIYHFGIRVSNQDQWLKIVQENDLKLYYGGVIEYPHSKSWYIHDPSGHEIEVSYTANSQYPFPQGGHQ